MVQYRFRKTVLDAHPKSVGVYLILINLRRRVICLAHALLSKITFELFFGRRITHLNPLAPFSGNKKVTSLANLQKNDNMFLHKKEIRKWKS